MGGAAVVETYGLALSRISGADYRPSLVKILMNADGGWTLTGGAAGIKTYGLALSRISKGRIIVPCLSRY